MAAINVWLAYSSMAHDKPGMGGGWDVFYSGNTASVSYFYYIWIP